MYVLSILMMDLIHSYVTQRYVIIKYGSDSILVVSRQYHLNGLVDWIHIIMKYRTVFILGNNH